ncbi:hypothetical protein DFH06DRAFT_1320074 [Mycena polygramma]|nr:hypothetical protein DFH06DRAFT_1320074 [Mycena polygramma]
MAEQAHAVDTLFDATVGVPASARHEWESMGVEERKRIHFVGKPLWHHLMGQVLVEGAGIIPASELHQWRGRLVDNKSHLARIAQALRISSGEKDHRVVPSIARVIEKGQGLEVAQDWVRRLLAPAIAIAQARNARRLLELQARASLGGRLTVVADSTLARQLKILRAMADKNTQALDSAARPDNPYAAPERPPFAIPSPLNPGREMMARIILNPGLAERLLTVVQTCVARSGTTNSDDPLPSSAVAGPSTLLPAFLPVIPTPRIRATPFHTPPSSPPASSPPHKRSRRSTGSLSAPVGPSRPPLSPLSLGLIRQARETTGENKRLPCPQCPMKARTFTPVGLRRHQGAKYDLSTS